MLIFFDKLWLGASYRFDSSSRTATGESISGIVQYRLSPALKGGISYDYSLSKIQMYNSGTFEVMLEYCIGAKGEIMTNPRFF